MTHAQVYYGPFPFSWTMTTGRRNFNVEKHGRMKCGWCWMWTTVCLAFAMSYQSNTRPHNVHSPSQKAIVMFFFFNTKGTNKTKKINIKRKKKFPSTKRQKKKPHPSVDIPKILHSMIVIHFPFLCFLDIISFLWTSQTFLIVYFSALFLNFSFNSFLLLLLLLSHLVES